MKIVVLHVQREDMRRAYSTDWVGRDSSPDLRSVMKALHELGHEASTLALDLSSFDYLHHLKKNRDVDLVFNLADDGFFLDSRLEPHVSAMLEVLRIPYTGSNYLTLGMCLHKDLAKDILISHGIPTPRFRVFKDLQDVDDLRGLRFPLIVKPQREDASIGINNDSVVYDHVMMKEAVGRLLRDLDQPALVEDYIDGREFQVGIIGDSETLPITEMVFSRENETKPRILNYRAKWVDGSEDMKRVNRACPAVVDKALKQKMVQLALQATSLLSCQDYARVDLRVDKELNPYVLEINPNPDIREDSEFFDMVKKHGLNYSQFIARIVESAIRRGSKQGW